MKLFEEAMRGDFNYPRRYEFESGGARAFMAPALLAKQAEVVREFEKVLSDVEREWERA